MVKEITKNLFYGLWSFKVIDVGILRSSTSVLVMISSMSVPICNRFHARQANSGTTFKWVLLFDSRVCRPPWTNRARTWTAKIYIQC